MDEVREGLGAGLAAAATFLPKFLGFLAILIIGYFVAKAVEKVVDRVLERVGFDRYVERGGVKRALANSKYDASSILGRLAFFVLFLFVLQLAFGIFGANPVSELIQGVIGYLPNIFVAIVILVVGFAIAAMAKEIIEASLGGLSYGRGLAFAASLAITVFAVFAALDQLEIAPTIVNTLFIGLIALVVGSGIVAIGGGGIQTMAQYWQRAAQRVEQESTRVKDEAQGAGERIQQRVEERKQQLQPNEDPAPVGAAGAAAPVYGSTQTYGDTADLGQPSGSVPVTDHRVATGGVDTSSSSGSAGSSGGVGEALKRDWEQTKNDVGLGGRDMDQDVNDTIRQAKNDRR